jgi:uncharacterized protein YggE
MRPFVLASALAAAALPAPVLAQLPVLAQAVAGTRLDISATGEVTRVPDLALVGAGVLTRAPTAAAAIAQNAAQLDRVRAALRRAGVAERDIQTSSLSLNPDFAYEQNQPPRLIAYQASHQLSVRLRDVRSAGRILDALVAAGANQVSGPTLQVDRPEPALDEARTRALAVGRQRADLYARSLGLRVVRLLSVSEGARLDGPVPMAALRAEAGKAADTSLAPGEQQLSVTLQMSFELQ